MAYCDKCGNFDKSHAEDFDLKLHSNELHYQPDLYYYWDSPIEEDYDCLLYTSPSPRDRQKSRMPSSA